MRWIASTCCVRQDKKSTSNCLYTHTEVTVKEGIFFYQLPHRDFIIRFSSFSGSLFSNESYSYGKRRMSFCLQVTWSFLVSSLGEVFMAGNWLWLDVGRQCSQFSLPALMENLPFNYWEFTKEPQRLYSVFRCDWRFTTPLGWICLKIVLDTATDMISFYPYHI